jgi:enterochelin esterase-like enzyme
VGVAALFAAAAISLPGLNLFNTQPAHGSVYQGVIPYAQTTQRLHPSLVYLPPGFSTARRYPVVYLLHGLPGSPLEYAHGLGLLDWADEQIYEGKLQPFIAVAPSSAMRLAGEWAGFGEQYLVNGVVPWVDANLPTIASADGRVIAGLSAGGFGAYDIGLRHLDLFGRLASWGGYFHPLDDGPFKNATKAYLRANDPWDLLKAEVPRLKSDGTKFFLSTGPPHSRWEKPGETLAFGRALSRDGLPVRVVKLDSLVNHWQRESEAGLRWAFQAVAR